MGGYRAERLAEMIHRELAERLRLEVKDPRLEPISITNIKVSGDLSRALVDYLPLGGGTPSPDLVDALGGAAQRLRGPIGRALRLRHAPQIVFQLDTHTETAVRVTSLLRELVHDEPVTEEGEGEE